MDPSMVSVGCFLLLIMGKCSQGNGRKIFNATRFLEGALLDCEYRLRTSLNHESSMIERDTSYLPENDYFEDYEIDENDQASELDRANRNLLPEYRNLCEIITRKIQMSDTEFEYQPPHYHEVFCKGYSLFDQTQGNTAKPAKQRCAHPGFNCVQRSRTLFMVRRRWEGDCWEPFTKEIASGCDCMWPVSTLGEISTHY